MGAGWQSVLQLLHRCTFGCSPQMKTARSADTHKMLCAPPGALRLSLMQIDQLLPMPWKYENICDPDTGQETAVWTNEHSPEGWAGRPLAR